MNGEDAVDWQDANQRYLMAALAEVRQALEHHAARSQDAPEAVQAEGTGSRQVLEEIASAAPAPLALQMLCGLFGLSPFERQVLLLCAGMELEGSFASLCAEAHGDPRRAYPTFGLALATLPGAHWSAVSPASPLRYWRLVEAGSSNGLVAGPLRIDERVLHFLTGMQQLDERLAGFVEPVVIVDDLVPSHRAVAERLAATWSRVAGEAVLPVVQLCGDESAGQMAIAAYACAALGLDLHRMPAHVIPLDPREMEALVRLWEREAALGASALLLDCGDLELSDTARENVIARVMEGTSSPLIVAGRERRSTPRCSPVTFEVHKPTSSEQRALWRTGLGAVGSRLDGCVEALASQFCLSAPAIYAICADALGRAAAGEEGEGEDQGDLGAELWDVCRVQTRPRLANLAQHIRPFAAWDDLVLPEAPKRILREIAVHVRHRMQVYETWGFASKGTRGLGISALFAGASGTGKTMAAEVLANELRLDLYRIDLSQVVSKYIGETEKNLRQVFDAAEDSGAILLFDEADALFGKRSEVKDSHDRYANIEISYLLQRMEEYRGLAILTTNMKDALDSAFLRRIRFVVQFPFPDADLRAEIWRRIFPADTPTKGLDVQKLARLNVAGGNIRNIALYAAFLAAEAGEPVRMRHLLRAAQVEYTKLERPLTEAETRGWV